MPSDYDQIRADNIKEYGEGTRHLSFLGRLYTDRTHFIFELLQNAEDAGASRVLFQLFEDKLEVFHDGRLFDEKDVRGICGVGEGTKTEDLTQIGKFGIGFKSVYAYTSTPEVHSGHESFRIENYVRPFAVHPRDIGDSWPTLFAFPFNKEDVEPEKACREISGRLRKLSARTLLFLRSIKEIEYGLPDGMDGVYLRDEAIRGSAREVTVIGQNNGEDESENWLIFERPVEVPNPGKDCPRQVPVEIGFRLEKNEREHRDEVVRVKDSPLVVHFPTEKETRFGFLIQGPYKTTPARDNIPKDDYWNEILVAETAILVNDTLRSLKDMGLLSVPLLEAMPIRMEEFPEGSMFYPIVDKVREALLKEELLPTDDQSFVSAANAKIARGGELRNLLNQDQLRLLFQVKSVTKWLSADITLDRTPDLRSYLMNELEVEEVTPDGFARKLSLPFLASQSDEWFIRFYMYLSGQEALWRSPRWRGDTGGVLRSKPILRLQDDSHKMLFPFDGTPNAFLPPPEDTDFPIVKREIVGNEKVGDFLKRLGLSEPDVFDDIVERVLPKYNRPDASSISQDEHSVDIQKILRAMSSDSEAGKKKVLRAAKNTPFLKAVHQNGNSSFRKPDKIYFPNEKLKGYFSGCRDVWFLDEATGEKEWKALGVEDKPRFKKISIDLSWEEKSRLRRNQGHTRDIETIDYALDGLEDFLARFEHEGIQLAEHSLILWNFLLDHLREGHHYSFYEGEYNWFYYNEKSVRFTARWKKQVVSHAWLPKGGDIRLHKPHDISPEELLDSFIRDEKMADLLGMKKDVVAKLAEEAGISQDTINLAKELENHPELLDEFRKKIRPGASDKESIATETDKICYKEELQKSFNRPGETELQEQITDNGKVRDPGRRREKSYEGHKDRIHNEPKPEERRKETMRTILEGPDEQVREYLSQLYGGKCQICGKTFPERDGKPFFIANYIVLKKLGRFVDTSANAMCLCAEHFAKWQHGSIETENISEQIETFKTESEGGAKKPVLKIKLCGEKCMIKFKEKHLLDLQELVRASKSKHDNLN